MTGPLVGNPLSLHPQIAQWLEPTPDRLIVHTGRVELGQGIHAAMARIAASELGLPQDMVIVPHASTDGAPIEGLTAGSMSISAGGMAVRRASKALRSLALERAAALCSCSPGDLTISNGRFLRGGTETGLTLLGVSAEIDLSREVAQVPVIDVPRTVPEDRPRDDIRDRVVGAPFLQDMVFDDMLHGRVIHPSSVPASSTEVDDTSLAGRPGVARVVRDGNFLGLLAEREWDAVRAATWAHRRTGRHHEAGAPDDIREALRHSNAPVEITHHEGDPPDAGLQRIVTRVSRPYTAHGSIGPSVAIARWDGEALTVWSHSQGIGPLRAALATALRIAPEHVTVRHVPSAGCYGHNGADDAALDAALLARSVPGRPVRLQWSRADEFGLSASGAAMLVEAEAQVGPEGHVRSMTVRPTSTPHINRPGWGGQPNLRSAGLISDPHPEPSAGDLPVAVGGGADRNAVPLYSIPHRKVEKRLVGTLPHRTSSQRALGAIGNILAIESLMDDIAVRTGVDPVALRLDHLEDARARAVIDTAVGMADPRGTGGDGVGWGLGFGRYKNTAGYCAVVAAVDVDEDVRVARIWSAVDAGEVISHDGVANQIEGGILQAMSWTLKESLPVSEGRVIAETWQDYPILKFSEVPPVALHILDHPEEPPLGVGEAAAGPTAAALSNAVRHALGFRIPDLPLDRDMIARTLLGA